MTRERTPVELQASLARQRPTTLDGEVQTGPDGRMPDGQPQAAACVVGRITFGALPRGVELVEQRTAPTIEIPYDRTPVLINRGRTPLYLVAPMPYKYEAERQGSGVPVRYLPFYRLANGQVDAWTQDTRRVVGTDPQTGVPIYPHRWQRVSAIDAFRRDAGGAVGVAVIPGSTPWVSIEGAADPGNCARGTPRPATIAISTIFGEQRIGIGGQVRYERVR